MNEKLICQQIYGIVTYNLHINVNNVDETDIPGFTMCSGNLNRID